MGESHDVMNLEWVQSDIEQTLLQAQENLEACLSGSDDNQAQLKNCLEAVHQVAGSLQMVGLSGAVLLTSKMEALLSRMLEGSLENLDEAYAALAQSLVHLPPYLARVKSDVEESPILLLKAINDIHQVLGEPLILEYSMFNPELGIERPLASTELKAGFAEQSAANIKKMRQIFQFALIGLIRNEEVKVNLVRVSNVLARLQQDCKGSRINQLWEISCAMIEGLIGGTIPLNSEVIELLRSTDKEIKRLADSGESGLDQQPKENLLKGMLYHIAKTSLDSPQIQAIKKTYHLERFQLENQNNPHARLFVGPDKDTLNSAVLALTEELQRIKDTIDLYVRNEIKANIDLGGLKPSLRQIASTLVMLNLEEPKSVVQEQLDILAEHSTGNIEIPNEKLLKIAEALLYVESQLQSIVERSSASQEDGIAAYAGNAAERVILESLSNMKQAKEDIQEFVIDSTDFEKLVNVPVILRSAYGGLSMISQSVAAQVVYSVAQFIEDDILALAKEPQTDVMDTLAEVVATVEYYLEGLAESKPANEKILEQAKVRIASMGYPVEQSEGISSEDGWGESQLEAEDDTFAITIDKDEAIELSNVLESESTMLNTQETEGPEEVDAYESGVPADGSDKVETETGDELIELESPLGLLTEWGVAAVSDHNSDDEEIRFELPADEDKSLEVEDTVEAEAQVAETLEESGAESNLTADQDAELVDEEPIDEEILEIFAEEAEEVIGAISEHWPMYVADYSRQDSLSEVRRAFHTLKGSGRMVKASVIAELAWSIENLLNHVIEGSLQINQAMVSLIDEVCNELPVLLRHFVENTTPEKDVSDWMEHADRLIAGEEIEQESLDEASLDNSQQEQPATETDELLSVGEEELGEIAESVPEESLELDILSLAEDDEEIDLELEEIPGQAILLEAETEVDDGDATLNEIFSQEANTHIAVLEGFIETYRQSGMSAISFTDELLRALHTIKGSAYMASLDVIGDIAAAGESLAKELGSYQVLADQEVIGLLEEAKNLIQLGVQQLVEEKNLEITGTEDLIQRIASLQSQRITQEKDSSAQSEEVLSPALRFLRDHIDPICSVTEQFEQWREQPELGSPLFEQMLEQVSQLNEASQECEQPEVETLLATLEYVYRTLNGMALRISPEMLSALSIAHEGLMGLIDQLAAGQQVVLSENLTADLDNALTDLQTEQEQTADTIPDSEPMAELPVHVESEKQEEQISEDGPEGFVGEIEDKVELQQIALPQSEEVDHELIEIFLSEADEIMEATAEAKQRWIENTDNFTAVDELQRSLHTLKGSSRMAGISAIGDLSHELESIYEDVNARRI
ncbi:MAG: Hpt domain-containing protein, partial [Pseudomonadales bacterium]|nr:Hpt domain-containing protein [Pseudomonadales bacterium]